MGYESRIIIVERHGGEQTIFGEIISEVWMSKMGYNNGWRELFKNPIDYKLYIDDCEDGTDKDLYGKHLTYTDIKSVVNWLEKEIQKGNDYRRLPVLLSLLKGFDESQWVNLQVVHYGY